MDSPDNTLANLRKSNPDNPICPYCGVHAKLVDGTIIYPHRYDLRDRHFYLCKNCDAYCGCHGGSTRSLGTPANAELREFRRETHKKFDEIWKRKKYRTTRQQAYILLATYMNLNPEKVHIGQFDLDQCQQAIEFVKQYYPNIFNKRYYPNAD